MSRDGPALALVESNTTGTGPLFARAAAGLGCRPVLLTADPGRYPFASRDRLEVLRVDTSDREALLAACRRLAAAGGLAGVTSSSEYFVATAALLAERLRLAAPAPQAVARCRDKGHQRRRLRAAGLAVPDFRLVRSAAAAAAAAAGLGLPVVVKPVSGTGSMGVRLCATAGEVAAAALDILRCRANERGQRLPRRVLVEKPALGAEYSVETFGLEIVGITRKHLGELPSFVEIGHDFPAPLPPEQEGALEATAVAALAALGLGWGAAHVEVRVTAGGPQVIEVNPRLAGGFIPELVRLAYGVDLVAQVVALAAGLPPRLARQAERGAAIRFLLTPADAPPRGTSPTPPAAPTPSPLPPAARLVRVVGLAAARRRAGVVDVALYHPLGTAVSRHGDFRDRLGHVIAGASTTGRAARAAEQAHGQIRLIVGPRAGA
jgi:biotin carboxylase